MRIRRIAILVDGGFFLKRIKAWPSIDRTDPVKVADSIRHLCKRHVQKLTGIKTPQGNQGDQVNWLDHVYRMFYYDARPYEGAPHHPFKNKQIEFGKSPEAKFRYDLFNELRNKRKFALRLGVVKNNDGDYWSPYSRDIKNLMKIWHEAKYIHEVLSDLSKYDEVKNNSALKAINYWKDLSEDQIQFPLRQKGVDMRIGLDITTMTMKKQVDTIILVTGDSDFIPAAKIARREGVEFILDPMWQSVEKDLSEHIDGLISGFDKPAVSASQPSEIEHV